MTISTTPSDLTREDIIRNEKASEISFRQEAIAAIRQAEFFTQKAGELRECADIAYEKWKELESEL